MDDQLKEILDKYTLGRRDTLIPILQDVQDKFGYISEENVAKIGDFLSLPTSKIYGLATFYNQFRFRPKARYHIQLCRGTTCHVNGASNLLRDVKKMLSIDDGETTRDGVFSLEVLSCVGACSQAPVMILNGEYHARVDELKLQEIISRCQQLENK
jgi:NADH-quinone oxidoreductase subunit E